MYMYISLDTQTFWHLKCTGEGYIETYNGEGLCLNPRPPKIEFFTELQLEDQAWEPRLHVYIQLQVVYASVHVYLVPEVWLSQSHHCNTCT